MRSWRLLLSNLGMGLSWCVRCPQGPGRWRGPLVAVGTAAAIVVAVAVVVLVLRGGSVGVSDTPVTETSVPVVPSETTVPVTATTVPPVAGPGGVVTVVVSDLTDAAGNDLAGVLMSYDAQSPDDYKWDGVAGFATTVDADSLSTSQTFGEVTEAWPEDPSEGLWPWPTGTASVPAGDYTLWLWTGKDYCCYSRWVPAATPGLRFCELRVSTTGQDQTIYVTDIPSDAGPCPTDPATAVTGRSRSNWTPCRAWRDTASSPGSGPKQPIRPSWVPRSGRPSTATRSPTPTSCTHRSTPTPTRESLMPRTGPSTTTSGVRQPNSNRAGTRSTCGRTRVNSHPTAAISQPHQSNELAPSMSTSPPDRTPPSSSPASQRKAIHAASQPIPTRDWEGYIR